MALNFGIFLLLVVVAGLSHGSRAPGDTRPNFVIYVPDGEEEVH